MVQSVWAVWKHKFITFKGDGPLKFYFIHPVEDDTEPKFASLRDQFCFAAQKGHFQRVEARWKEMLLIETIKAISEKIRFLVVLAVDLALFFGHFTHLIAIHLLQNSTLIHNAATLTTTQSTTYKLL